MNGKPKGMHFDNRGTLNHDGDIVGRDKNINIYMNGNPIPGRKQFTDKNLVVPFTRERSNGAQGGTYVQRDDLLGKMDDCYRSQVGGKRIAFLSGMGGSGKSELARAYADMHCDEYEEIFWLTCKDGVGPDLMGLFSEAYTLGEAGKEDVAGFSDKVLIIVDNCNSDDGKFLLDLEKTTGNADILVTTRLGSMGNYDDLMISVESDDQEAFSFSVFEKNYCKRTKWGKSRGIEEFEKDPIREICREVQYNTMMVSMLGIRLREYSDLSISDCSEKIRRGVGELRGRVRYSKDQNSRTEEIRDTLRYLFSDVLNHSFTNAEKKILTVLSLIPASWFEMDYILSLCRGTLRKPEYEDASKTLLNLGWLQGSNERMTIHPLIAEVISDEKIIIRESEFFEGLIDNYLGMSDQYLKRERFLINKILSLGKAALAEKKMATMLLINHGGYKKVFADKYPNVNVAYFAFVDHAKRRYFLFRDLETNETNILIDVPCQVREGKRVELLHFIDKGFPYKLDLNTAYFGKTIEVIPKGFCWNDSYLNECIFPGSLKEIGDGAFRSCRFLRGELKLPEGLTRIGDRAFYGCYSLSGELRLPESLTSIGDSAFSYCDGFSGELKLPEGLTSIGDSAFERCKGLIGELRLPESLTSIGNRAFYNCGGLGGELRLPEGLTSIGDHAFEGCRGLSGELRQPEDLMSIRDSELYYCDGWRGELRLPEGLTRILDNAFKGRSDLGGELRLPEGLTSIGDHAFEGCRGLSGELKLPEGLISIGDHAFEGCWRLGGELRLPKGLTRIGDRAFEGCSGLKSIGGSAYYSCSGMSGELRLPEGLTRILGSAFKGRSDLSGVLKLPEGLTSIGDRAFYGCYSLSGELRLPESLTSVGNRAFYNCSGLRGELSLPEGLTSIGDSAFEGCSGLSGKLRLPKGLTRIGDSVFCGCSGLSGKLKLPKGLTSIGDRAFEDCIGLSGELRLPEGITSLGDGAFLGCSGLNGELRLPEGLTSIGDWAFLGCSGLNGELRLPEGLTSIGDRAFLDCSGLSGELKLPEGLISIGDHAFEGCWRLRGELRLPKGLTRIGDRAFEGCIGLSGKLRLPESLTRIGDSVFYGCNSLEKILFYNPKTELKGTLNPYSSTIICGFRNSTAEDYARTHELVFEELKELD